MNQSNFTDTFFVLDFDRCIGDTDKIHDILWRVIESETGIQTADMQAVKNIMESKDYSFDTAEYVAKELLRRKSGQTWQQVRDVFVSTAQLQDVLEPRAADLLDLLDSRKIPYGILTYGKEAWQLTKLEAAGLVGRGVPFEITLIEHKGKILTGWKHGAEFIVPPALTRDFLPLRAQNIVFLDDKPRSFVGIPARVRGICVRPARYPLLPSQRGDLPEGVEEVRGIKGAINRLQLQI